MWVRYRGIRKPYYDVNGNVLESIAGRRNRFGKDEFFGGGWLFPDLAAKRLVQRGGMLYAEMDSAPDIQNFKYPVTARIVKNGHKVTSFVYFDLSDFSPKVLGEGEIKAGGLLPPDNAATKVKGGVS